MRRELIEYERIGFLLIIQLVVEACLARQKGIEEGIGIDTQERREFNEGIHIPGMIDEQ